MRRRGIVVARRCLVAAIALRRRWRNVLHLVNGSPTVPWRFCRHAGALVVGSNIGTRVGAGVSSEGEAKVACILADFDAVIEGRFCQYSILSVLATAVCIQHV